MVQTNVRALRSGDIGVITDVSAPLAAAKRLADMGFIRGMRLEMVRTGSPCIVRIGGTCVGLGRGYQIGIQLLCETETV